MCSVPVYMPSMQQQDREELQVCPYDPVHRVRKNRFVRHLLKCRANNRDCDMAVCNFNARHIVPKPELQLHLSNCPDKRMIEHERAYERLNIDGDEARGDTSVPPYNDNHFDFGDEENWDREVQEYEQHRPSYRIVKTSTKYTWDDRNSEVPFEDEAHQEARPARPNVQTSQPFPMERRPAEQPRLRAGVTGTGRGKLLKQQPQHQEKHNTAMSSLAGPTVASPSLAANFRFKPKTAAAVRESNEESSRPSLQRVERARLPTQNPKFTERGVDANARVPTSPPQYVQISNPQESGEDSPPRGNADDVKKERRKLVKSLKQISYIEAKVRDGRPVNDDEKVKMEKKKFIEERLQELSLQL